MSSQITTSSRVIAGLTPVNQAFYPELNYVKNIF